MWKDFFYYSKGERRAVYVLSLLIVLFMIGSWVLPEFVEKPKQSGATQEEKENFSKSIREKKEERNVKYVRQPKREIVLKEFDPNTADSTDFLNLGLPPFVVSNILKYRAKGGKFATPESFARIYGMTDERFAQLKPYIHISEAFVYRPDTLRNDSLEHPMDTFPKMFKYPEGTLVDVGIADTTELKKIPGIGSGIAKAIVAHRNRLGGFYSLEQLGEVEYITPDLMKWFKLEEVDIRKLNINQAGLDKLRAHPYLNFYQAKVIIEHRRKRGEIKSLSQLSLYEEFTGKDLERLSAYIAFD